MNKKLAKFNFVLTSIILIVAVVLCFAQFNLPGSTNKYNGMFNAISATSEISYGNSAVYKIVSDDSADEDVDKTVDNIRSILDSQGYVGSKVYRQGEYIRAEVESKTNSSNILSIIGDSKSFYISNKSQEDLDEKGLESFDIIGTDIKEVTVTPNVSINGEYFFINIYFKSNDKLETLVSNTDLTNGKKVLYFYIDGKLSTNLEVEEGKDYLSFYSTSYTKETAQNYAFQILMSSTGVNLKTISNNTTTATLGKNVLLLSMIALGVMLLALLILFPIFFGDFGLLANLSTLFAMVFAIFVLQALPLTTGSIATIFGVIVGLGLLALTHVIYLNKIKSEFAYLGRLQLAVKTGFKKSWLIILDITVITFIASLILVLWNIPYVSTFAIGLAIMSFIALLNNVLLLKDFITWYVNINKKDYKRVKFTKGENND